jgi:hypothetical protein
VRWTGVRKERREMTYVLSCAVVESRGEVSMASGLRAPKPRYENINILPTRGGVGLKGLFSWLALGMLRYAAVPNFSENDTRRNYVRWQKLCATMT